MKILFDSPNPFSLAHGGFQTQVEETKRALEAIGVSVDWLRWWQDSQDVDLIHYFGIPSLEYLRRAQIKSVPVVLTHLLTGTCNRPDWKLIVQGAITRTLLKIPGWSTVRDQLSWPSLRSADRLVVGLEAEKYVLRTVFGISDERISVVPLGLPDEFLGAPVPSRDKNYLVTTGTITARKRSVELAQMAIRAEVPVLFAGKPYDESDPYWKQFQSLIDDRFVLYQRHIQSSTDMITLLGSSRGFVIYSVHENWCLSAHEAAACGIPLLIQDQKWSRERFGDQVHYLAYDDFDDNVRRLRQFYEACPSLPSPQVSLYSWKDVARHLEQVYRNMLNQGPDSSI